MLPLSSSQRNTLERYLTYPLGEAGAAYLEARGLLEVATDLRFGEVSNPVRADHQQYAGRLVIPSFSARGGPVDIAFRCIQPHVCDETVLWTDDKDKPHYCPKYLFLPGFQKRLYHVESVQTNESVIHITEGQLDAATLVACGLPAVGVPGSQSWKPHAHRLFQGFDRVCFWADQDDKGASMELFEKIRQGVSTAEVIVVAPGEDVNSMFQKHGKAGLLALLEEKPEGEDAEPADDGDELGDWTPPVVHYDELGDVIPF